ncbi:MAG: cell division protein ZapA [Alphaproteobacteria bacterium]|nr:cell division protein ZapA [Alphaproteobacteria bacterium]MCW5743172.1 cell division protein ZapA [Alphaproteobacteria bacterium]
MPHVSVRINNRQYEIACAEGEEERLLALAADLDECVIDLRKQIAGAPEIKLLVLGALMMADKAREVAGRVEQAEMEAARARGELQVLREELASVRAEASRRAAAEPEVRLEDLFSGLETRIEGLARKVAAA